MNKKTIAEFVENEKCLQVLKEIGIDYCQGFYIGRPDNLPVETGIEPDYAGISNSNVIGLFRNHI